MADLISAAENIIGEVLTTGSVDSLIFLRLG